jgi:hypothetical protein
MPRYAAITALRQRLSGLVPTPAAPAAAPPSDHFSDSLWAAESRIRESIDALVYPSRWRVTWLPAESGPVTPRVFYLKGTHAQVTARAHAFFVLGTVVIEPAPFLDGEIFDRRVNIIGRISS